MCCMPSLRRIGTCGSFSSTLLGVHQEAAVHLAYAEYDDLSVLERIAILRGLSALALSADAVRDYISTRLEAMPAPAPPRLKKVLRRDFLLIDNFWLVVMSLSPGAMCVLAGCSTEDSCIPEGSLDYIH